MDGKHSFSLANISFLMIIVVLIDFHLLWCVYYVLRNVFMFVVYTQIQRHRHNLIEVDISVPVEVTGKTNGGMIVDSSPQWWWSYNPEWQWVVSLCACYIHLPLSYSIKPFFFLIYTLLEYLNTTLDLNFVCIRISVCTFRFTPHTHTHKPSMKFCFILTFTSTFDRKSKLILVLNK